ncbi:MAG TPA: membrane protein insertion efficiency factor YidD [Bacilli bacterium]|nr:membrane protein insertion efficiency factor YidD [Bacilli bacterium]HPX84118.1 membrane protein insertion efficiency factor YidD [Bacilli bacterium]HQC75065.1 membrane protein insertion efficiency factor YidD [Bacilli bacterium]
MNKIPIKLIRWYQKRNFEKGTHCRFSPTCSHYSLQAYQKFPFMKASLLSLWRIIRCNPLSKGGYDPVPPTRIEKLFKNDFE